MYGFRRRLSFRGLIRKRALNESDVKVGGVNTPGAGLKKTNGLSISVLLPSWMDDVRVVRYWNSSS